MKLTPYRIGILVIALVTLLAVFIATANDLVGPDVPDLPMLVANIYNRLGPWIAPNQVTVVLFDWRGFDTLGECMVLGTAVMVTALVFGRGVLKLKSKVATEDAGEPEPELVDDTEVEKPHNSIILKLFGYPIVILLMAYSITIVIGGHLSPGGGFQAGAIFASSVLLGIVIYGMSKRPIGLSTSAFHKYESFGIMLFLILGLLGLIWTGYYMYNLGADLPYMTSLTAADIGTGFTISKLSPAMNYPEGAVPYTAGIIPYLNIAVFFKVLGSLSGVVLILAGAKKV